MRMSVCKDGREEGTLRGRGNRKMHEADEKGKHEMRRAILMAGDPKGEGRSGKEARELGYR